MVVFFLRGWFLRSFVVLFEVLLCYCPCCVMIYIYIVYAEYSGYSGSSSFCPHFLDQFLTAIGQLPVRFKEFWGLPLADRGIDSPALNLSVAVQAKDYEKFVPLNRLATWLGGIARAQQMWIPIEHHGANDI